jgi:hypothetical protein
MSFTRLLSIVMTMLKWRERLRLPLANRGKKTSFWH